MAIRNTAMGGTDWTAGELGLNSADLNDTFDAAFSKIQTLTMFWMNSDLSTVYDDFDSYPVGAFTTNSLWTVSTVAYTNGIATSSIASSTTAGGSSKELVLVAKGEDGGLARNSTVTVNTIGLSDDTHKYVRVAWSITAANNGCSLEINFGSQTYTVIITGKDIDETQYFDIKVIALGSNNYDVYVGGKKIYSNVNEADPQIYFRVTGGGAGSSVSTITVYIDDVIESSGSV